MIRELMLSNNTHVDGRDMKGIVGEMQAAADQIMNRYKLKMVEVSLVKDENTLQFSISESQQQLKHNRNQELTHHQKQYYKP